MKKKKKLVIGLFILFICLLSLTIYTSFSSNTDIQVVEVKSMTPTYDETSTVEVDNNNVVFNDKNQVVKYNVVLENTQYYDVKISDITLSTPIEEFLKYEVEELEDKVIKANSTKELIVSFETMGIKGWGRNFADELTANISFEKIAKQEEVVPPTDEDKEISKEKPQDTTDKEDLPVTKPSTDNKDESNKEEDNKVENPYTSDKKLVGILGIATCITGATILIVSNNKFTKYSILIIMLGSTLSLVNADEILELPVKFNIEFKSQNVMKSSGCNVDLDNVTISDCSDYWQYYENIKNFNILTEKVEIEEYVYKFDVTEKQNGRVIAYVVNSDDNSVCYSKSGDEVQCYDVYLQADGIIYPNSDSSVYFGGMLNLSSIENLNNFDTSNVTNMFGMFAYAGYASSDFEVDISTLNTSNVTDMSFMFAAAANQSGILDVSNFDTNKVTNMGGMFWKAGYANPSFTLDVSGFDTSNVTDMSYMFWSTGRSSDKLDIVLTIKNPNTNIYLIFSETAIMEGSKIKVNYTNLTKGIANRMVNTKSDGANVVLGNMVEEIKDEDLTIGDEVEINGEYFNVVSQTEDTVTLLPQYNLSTDYRQSTTANNVTFSTNDGWEYTPGPKEIDIQTWSTNPKTYVNAYVEYLKEQLGDDTVTGDLITLKDLEELGCTVPSDYAWGSGEWNCYDSPYGWIANGQYWWTRSVFSTGSSSVWCVFPNGYLYVIGYFNHRGVRPVITISKETLRNLDKI